MKINPTALLALIFVALALPIFAQGWSNPFVLDDMSKIQWNPDLRNPHPSAMTFFTAFTTPSESAFRTDPSRPLTYLIYWMCWQVGGGQAAPFHILNTLLHILCALLTALITLRLADEMRVQAAPSAGMLAGLYFLFAPLLAGTVLYAYGLSDILAAFFVLMALQQTLANSRAKDLIWANLFFLLALAAKQSAAVYPILLLAFDFTVGGWGRVRERRRVLAPPFAITLVYLLGRGLYFGGIGDLEAHGDVISAPAYFLAQGLMLWKYFVLLFFPLGLSIDHYLMPEMYSDLVKTLAWLVVALVTGLALFTGWKAKVGGIWRLWAFAWLAFLICLLPTSSFLPTVDLFVERRAYLAGAAVAIAFGLGADRLVKMFPHWRWPLSLLVIGILLGNTFLTFQRTQVYRSAESLWREALALAPENPRARLNMASTLSATGGFAEARPLLEGLLPQQPRNGLIYAKLAFIYQQKAYAQHDDEKAWGLYLKSFALDPDNIFALLNAGALLMDHSRFTDAEQLFAHALALNPNMPYSHLAMGEAQLGQRNYADASAHFRQALQLDPGFAAAKDHLTKLGLTP